VKATKSTTTSNVLPPSAVRTDAVSRMSALSTSASSGAGAQGFGAAVENGQSVPDGDRPLGGSGADDPGSADEQDPQGGVAGKSGDEGVHACYNV
jgi:hypothetical protein